MYSFRARGIESTPEDDELLAYVYFAGDDDHAAGLSRDFSATDNPKEIEVLLGLQQHQAMAARVECTLTASRLTLRFPKETASMLGGVDSVCVDLDPTPGQLASLVQSLESIFRGMEGLRIALQPEHGGGDGH